MTRLPREGDTAQEQHRQPALLDRELRHVVLAEVASAENTLKWTWVTSLRGGKAALGTEESKNRESKMQLDALAN